MSNISRANTNRITGLSSGLDIDALVKATLSGQQAKLNKANQQKTMISWQTDSYRTAITKLSEFQSKFLDILNPSSILRKSSLNPISANVSEDAKKYLSVSSTNDSNVATINVGEIKTIATAQRVSTQAGNSISTPINMNVNSGNISDILGKTMSITLDGVQKNITFSSDIADYTSTNSNGDSGFDMDVFTADFNEKIKNQFGTVNNNPKINLSFNTEYDEFNNVKNYSLTLSPMQGSSLQVANQSLSQAMGFTNNQTSFINIDQKVSSIFNGQTNRGDILDEFGNSVGTQTNALKTDGGSIKFSINGQDFDFSINATLKEIMNKVNTSTAGVKMAYSSATDSFTMTASQMGSGDNIVLKDTGTSNFLAQAFGQGAGTIGTNSAGTDAVLTVNGQEIVRSSNSFQLDGVNFNLLQATPENYGNIAVTTKNDPTATVNTIKEFVDGYNTLINDINTMVNEKKSKGFLPLTTEQKEAMTEKEIENYELEGRKGLLKNDPTITKMMSALRAAITTSVTTEDGTKINLSSLGVQTAKITESKFGKLVIDEAKLKQSVLANPDAIIKLFTQTSSIPKTATLNAQYISEGYETSKDLLNGRNNQLGIAQRFSELFTKNISTTYMNEGSLIKIAGTSGKNAIIDSTSTLGKKLSTIETSILAIQKRLYLEEDRAYAKFANLETSLARLNAQGTNLFSTQQ